MASLVESLIRAYRNEKCTKEILPYEERLMVFLKKNLPKQIEYTSSVKKSNVLKSIYEQEIERVKYFMREYITTRMTKISQSFDVDKTMLNDFEARYCESMYNVYKDNDVFVECKWTNKEFVGFVSLVDSKNVILDKSSVELKKGDFFVAPVKDIIGLLYNNEVYLV